MFRRRYFRILFFFSQTFLNVIWWDLILAHIGFRRWAHNTRVKRMKTAAQRFRKLAVQMGGVMIKVGQFLSARLDVLPREITDELSGLQDEVAPEPFEPIRALIEAEFGMPLEQKFCEFNHVPMAAASIGQVYSAKVCDIREDGSVFPAVVVKVQRPHIEKIIDVDLSALKIVGGWLQRYKPISKRVSVPKLMEEFSRTLYEEVDYLHEGKNAEAFAENFKEMPDVRVPQVMWTHTTKRVLTLEDVGGIKITDYSAIEAAGMDRSAVAKRLLDTYLKQIFEDGFFHADPHPGNLFVQPAAPGESKDSWKLTFVDFGMAGTLPENTFNALREMVMAVGTQDAPRLMRSFEMLDMLLPGSDIALIERAVQRVFDRFWGKSMAELRTMHAEEAMAFAEEFSDLMYEMPFQAPEDLILLARCVSILSGICTGLDPHFNLFQNLTPYAEKLIQSEGGGKWKLIWDEVVAMAQKLLTLPVKADALISTMEQGRLEVRSPGLMREMERLNRSQRKMVTAVVFAAFLLGGVQLFVAKQSGLAIGFGVAAGLTFLLLLFTR
jgi:predicted unusual protein kinase regulating ubiquinone biosynthesis (AarF/ABC1/UbiB family)